MALYEYLCAACNTLTERRMPMSDVVQQIKCPKCGKRAAKTMGNFAIVGGSEASLFDSPAPWDDDGEGFDDDDGPGGLGGHDHSHDHGHSHGPGGHTH